MVSPSAFEDDDMTEFASGSLVNAYGTTAAAADL
jgi:hypothetical protein